MVYFIHYILTNIEVQFWGGGGLYIMDLVNACMVEHIKVSIMQHSVDAVTLL